MRFSARMAGLAEYRAAWQDDNFWSWRDLMYRFAERMTPEGVEAVAQWLYIEMLKAGYTAVCEFHYVHHTPDGSRYAMIAELADRIVDAAWCRHRHDLTAGACMSTAVSVRAAARGSAAVHLHVGESARSARTDDDRAHPETTMLRPRYRAAFAARGDRRSSCRRAVGRSDPTRRCISIWRSRA